MTDRYFQLQERRLKRQLQKMISTEDRILNMYDEYSSILMNVLLKSGYQLDTAEQDLIVTALLKCRNLAGKGNIFDGLDELIPHDDNVEEIFDKIISGNIWRNAAQQEYIDRRQVLDFLTESVNTHDKDYDNDYAWIVKSLPDIENCIQRINMLNPEAEPHQLPTDIAIDEIAVNRRNQYSACFELLNFDFNITDINKKLALLIKELLASEANFIESCKREFDALLQFKESHTLSKAHMDKLDEAVKHYSRLDDLWSRAVPHNANLSQVPSESDFIEDGSFTINRELNRFFINANWLSNSNAHKKYFDSLSWLMVNQCSVLDIMSNTVGGLDKLNANYSEIKNHTLELHTRLNKTYKIFQACFTEMQRFAISVSQSELHWTNAPAALEALTDINNMLSRMNTSVSIKSKKQEVLDDLSKGLEKCKIIYDGQTGGARFWSCKNTVIVQFINDLTTLINCNAVTKIDMLVQHINKNIATHAKQTDVVNVLNRFLEKVSGCQSLSVIEEPCQTNRFIF